MADKQSKIVNTRTGHLGRAVNSLEDALAAEVLNKSEIDKYLGSVSLKLNKLQEESEKLVEILIEQEDIEKELDRMDGLQDKITDIQMRAKLVLEKLSKPPENPQSPTQPRLPKDISTPKLPELECEKFDGDLEQYQQFMDCFESTIHNNPKLSDVDKFRYLRLFLEDQKPGDGPKSLIAGFATTSSNYKEALELIRETYGKKSRIIMSHVSKLLNLKVENSLDQSSLRVLYNKVNIHVRSLRLLGVDVKQYGVFLVPIVESKLSHTFLKEWKKNVKTDDDNIMALLEFMEWELKGLEEARQIEDAFSSEKEKSNIKTFHSKENKPSSKNNSHGSAIALNTVTHVRKKDCLFCPNMSDHFGHQCKKAESLSPKELRNILSNERACFCCFKKGHRKADCNYLSSLSCAVCKRKHHTFLHENLDTVNSITGCSASTSGKLRPIARGRLVGPTGKQLEVNVMLDPCSDESFIDQKTSTYLELPSQGHIDLNIGGINGHIEESKRRKVVGGVIKHRYHLEKFRQVKLIEVPSIMNNLKRPAVKSEMLRSRFLKDLPLADDYETPRNFDINVLIGLDQYFSICSGQVKRAPEKPILLDSLFGWIILGDSEKNVQNP